MNAKKRTQKPSQREKVGTFSYESVSFLTGKSIQALHQDYTRGNLDIEDLASLVRYVARHANPILKAEILLGMTERDLDMSVVSRKRQTFMKKRAESRSHTAARKRTGSNHKKSKGKAD